MKQDIASVLFKPKVEETHTYTTMMEDLIRWKNLGPSSNLQVSYQAWIIKNIFKKIKDLVSILKRFSTMKMDREGITILRTRWEASDLQKESIIQMNIGKVLRDLWEITTKFLFILREEITRRVWRVLKSLHKVICKSNRISFLTYKKFKIPQ